MLQAENVDDDVTDSEFTEINTSKPPQAELLPIQIKEVEKVVPNNIGHVKNTFDEVCSQFTIALQSSIKVKSKHIPNINAPALPTDTADKIKPVDVDDHFVATQDINNDLREKFNITLVNAEDELLLCSVDGNVKNEQNIMPKQIIPSIYEKKVNVDNDVTDCQFGEINANKPPQGELTQDEMVKQVINLDDYKKDKELDEDMLAENFVSEGLPIQIKKIDRAVPNNTEHVKNTFDEVVSQLTIASPSPIEVKSEEIPNIILPNATQDINTGQRGESKISLVVKYNADDEVVLGWVSGNVQNEQGENKNTYCGIDLPSQENMDYISANYVKSTNVSDSSDEESIPKKSKRFTFTDSDFPDSDEITDIVMTYPRPAVVESFSESDSDHSFDDEIDEILRRFRNNTVPDTKIDLSRLIGVEYLPDRVMTRLRNSAPMFKPIYVNEQEDEMDEDIILENIKRLKAFKKAKDAKKHKSIRREKTETTPRKKTGNKNKEYKRKVKVNIEQPVRKGKKSKIKSFARNNTKKDSLDLISISAAKTITRRTRSMKKENDAKNTQNKCIFPGNKTKTPHQPDHKRKPYNKERICPEVEGRRSKRQQKAKEKNDDTMKAPISILKKNKPKQSTVYNDPSSSSESPKSLKRSLVDDSDVPSSKLARSHNNNNNKSVNNASLRATPARAATRQSRRTRHVHLSAFPDKEDNQDKLIPYVHLERYEPAEKLIRTLNSNRSFLTRSQLARRRYHRACKRTREAAERRKKGARTSTKRV